MDEQTLISEAEILDLTQTVTNRKEEEILGSMLSWTTKLMISSGPC